MHRPGRKPSKLSIEQRVNDTCIENDKEQIIGKTSPNMTSHVILLKPASLGKMGENEVSELNGSTNGVNGDVGLTPPRPSQTFPLKNAISPPLHRPPIIRFHSSPSATTLSPTRHHFRLPNQTPREIKETLNANFKEDEFGKSINQYTVKEVIGRGSFGEVRLAMDENTKTLYAIKEYSKQRLKKLNRSEMMLKRRRGRQPQHVPADDNPIDLIRREVAIMKKLDHLNIVSLIEVLDDPHGDLIYVILEYCEKGVIMPVNKNDYPSGHYSDEQCRLYFRDMILGVEYLHSQGIIHRDIKAENVLVSEDDIVKIVDFGVSEMFEKGNDIIKKTAGSPAYMAPELIFIYDSSLPTSKESTVSGRSADIWSMGVTLYYMRFGYLPFQADTVGELYYEILNRDPSFESDCDIYLKDLLLKILEKDPIKRIKMNELRTHPWVTCQGKDLLLSTEENTADCITPVTDEDLMSAIELIEGVMDIDQASAKLRKLHGWRGSLNGEGISRESSRSPVSIMSDSSENGNNTSGGSGMFKLTRALNEILSKDRLGSRSTGASPLFEPYNMLTSPTHVELNGPNGNEGYFNHRHEDIDRKENQVPETVLRVQSPSPDRLRSPSPPPPPPPPPPPRSPSPPPRSPSPPPPPSPTLQRRPSRSRTRQFLGLEMTSIRSRSLDTDDRL